MKNKITLALMCLLFTGLSFAQQQRNCYAMDDLENRKALDPGLTQRMAEIERFTEQKLKNLSNTAERVDGQIITLPVVVHVLYTNSTNNISAAQIQSQLDVLNADFRRTNSDANSKWSQAADSQIEFKLATVDPNGNVTTGVTRTQVSNSSFDLQNQSTSNDMKKSSRGGVDPWDTSKYLNMWIVDNLTRGSGTILGFAQFPGGDASTDGVVMADQYFGTTGTAQAPFDGGRTTTHEVGHFLNLRHIWGDGACGVDDFVSDTPASDAPNYGCASSHSSCGSQDMVENYMDYSDDTCMNLFTLGQKNRMRAVLEAGGVRRSLALSDPFGGGSTATCSDGIQNGDETGVDCGGSSCSPCQTGVQYCASNGNSVNDEYIGRVQLGTINNATGASSGGYGDYTSQSTDLGKGDTESISITPVWTGTLYNEGYAVFIDYNQDGDFTDAGETVFTNAPSQTNPVTGSFTVPTSAVSGTTRMRVSLKYNGVPTSCESFQYGEVEDYTVNITASAGDTQAPSVPSNLSASSVAQTTLTLSWNASTDNVGVTEYEVFSNGSSIGTLAGTSANITGLTASTTYSYTVTAKDAAGNVSATSSALSVTTLAESTGGFGCSNGVSAFPYIEGFENTLGAWSQDSGDTLDWTLRSGGTPSSSTGPSSASEGTYYVYVEASNPNFNKTAILNSPCFDLSAEATSTLTFKYQMSGNAVGTLRVDASSDNGATWSQVFTISGAQGSAWQNASVDLNAYAGGTVKLRLVVNTTGSWQGDIAVDALSLSDGSAPADRCDGVPAYNSSNSYSTGDQVVFQGTLYERTNTGWINLGACGTARTAQSLDEVAVSVYPNPVKGNTLFVQLFSENDASYRITNTLGQVVAKGTFANQIDVQNLQSGIYMLQVIDGEKSVTKKFIRN